MNRKNIILLVLAITISLTAILIPIYAWIIGDRSNVIVVVGDVEIDVEGWLQITIIGEEPSDEYNIELKNDLINELKDIASNQSIAFKFKVTNLTDRDGLLSIRMSTLNKPIFEKFLEYHKVLSKGEIVSDSLKNKIDVAAATNTAKLSYNIYNVYYIDSYGTLIKLNTNESLWNFSNGENIFEDVILLKKDDTLENSSYFYFTFLKNETALEIEAYRLWLLGDGDKKIGYGQEYCANLLGYTWDVLPKDDQTIVNKYLNYFVDAEIASINVEKTILNLFIEYFEFSCVNKSE